MKPDDIDAIFVNYITVRHTNEGVRVTFLESPDGSEGNARPRAAIFLPRETFKRLGSLVDEVVSRAGAPN